MSSSPLPEYGAVAAICTIAGWLVRWMTKSLNGKFDRLAHAVEKNTEATHQVIERLERNTEAAHRAVEHLEMLAHTPTRRRKS